MLVLVNATRNKVGAHLGSRAKSHCDSTWSARRQRTVIIRSRDVEDVRTGSLAHVVWHACGVGLLLESLHHSMLRYVCQVLSYTPQVLFWNLKHHANIDNSLLPVYLHSEAVEGPLSRSASMPFPSDIKLKYSSCMTCQVHK